MSGINLKGVQATPEDREAARFLREQMHASLTDIESGFGILWFSPKRMSMGITPAAVLGGLVTRRELIASTFVK